MKETWERWDFKAVIWDLWEAACDAEFSKLVSENKLEKDVVVVVVVALLFYVHGKHLTSCRDGQLT